VSTYQVKVLWCASAPDASFAGGNYSRGHSWEFDGGVRVSASSSPHNVPVPLSVEEAVDPEEAFVASLSSCHMLFFLHVARNAGLIVERYEDHAVGTLEKDADDRMAITEVVLRPEIEFVGRAPGTKTLAQLHRQAHEACFIANSVKTRVLVKEPLSTERRG
jgi:organic hydroperoxide reductase OsmC/OhrA